MTDMFSVAVLLVSLVAVAGCVTCLILVRYRKRSQERRIAQSTPAGKISVGSDFESDAGTEAVPVEETELPADEAPSTNGLKEIETEGTHVDTLDPTALGDGADAEKTDLAHEKPRAASELKHGMEEDFHVQRPVEAVHAEPVSEQPVIEPAQNSQTSEVDVTQESEAHTLGDLSSAHRRVEEQHGDAVAAIVEEGQGEKSAEVTAQAQVPIARDKADGSRERQPDTTTKLDVAPVRAKSQKNKTRKAKPREKKDPLQLPIETRAKESGDDEQLVAEVPEITEDNADHRPWRPPQPSQYRPPSQEPVIVPQTSRSRKPMREARQQSFDLTVRLLFQRSEQFSLGLLPQRGNDLPEEISLGLEGNRHAVTAVHDGWYGDICPEDLSTLLVDGISWEGRAESEVLGHWTLSGRDLYVLAAHGDLRGFVQTTRLKIGRKHVVLCRNPLLAEVEPVLYQAGCANITILNESSGAPPGWTVIRDVLPTKVARIDTGEAILSILRPEPELEIEFQGGIHLQQRTWLRGFPPCICVCGDLRPEVEVFIDGNRAIADNGSFMNQGYDAVGEHVVSIPIANKSRTYRITEGEQSWTSWGAHCLERVQLCGPLLGASDGLAVPRPVVVPSSNSVILGAKPGEIAYCPRIRGPRQVGCVTFDAVWAIPVDAFGCDKTTTTICLLNARQVFQTERRQFTGKEAERVMEWSTAILNAARKGLLVEESDPYAPVLWREYKSRARTLWKTLKK